MPISSLVCNIYQVGPKYSLKAERYTIERKESLTWYRKPKWTFWPTQHFVQAYHPTCSFSLPDDSKPGCLTQWCCHLLSVASQWARFLQQSVVWHSLWAFSEDTVKGPYDPHSKWVQRFCNFTCISVKRNRTREVTWLAWGHSAKPRRIGAVSPTSTPTFFSLPAPCLSALRLMALTVGFYITVTFKPQNVMFSQPCYN